MVENQSNVHVYSTDKSTGEAAGSAIEACIVALQKRKDTIRMIFAAAPSQSSTLAYLAKSEVIDWGKITAFHMDEYLGLPKNAPELFSTYLEENIFSKVNLKGKFIIDVNADVEPEIKRYSRLINEAPIDIVCLGIGENGHIAFNDPPVADFNDPETMKVVKLDNECRIQQVNDGCYPTINDVPEKALTLTVPTLFKGKNLFCVVLGKQKSKAVKATLTGGVSTDCPASILTTHPNCNFYFDQAAFQQVVEQEMLIMNL